MKSSVSLASAGQAIPTVRRKENRLAGAWRKSAGLLPMLIFCLGFEILPLVLLAIGSLQSNTGGFTLANYSRALDNRLYRSSFRLSLQISLLTAVIGTVMGAIIGYLIYTAGPRARNFLVSLSSVTANFAGIPLAFAFVVTLGANGFVTVFLRDQWHFDLYGRGITIYSFYGLALVYSYFQLPLMVLLVMPAFRGLRTAWREAASSLGATAGQYWWRVGLPILFPAIASSFFLLVANALGAYATAFGLSGTINLITIQIGFLISGDTSLEPALANALAMILIFIMSILVLSYQLLGRRAERWLSR